MKILVTTIPFGELNPKPLRLMEEAGAEYVINPLGRKLTENDLYTLIDGFDVVIAGTELITERILDKTDR